MRQQEMAHNTVSFIYANLHFELEETWKGIDHKTVHQKRQIIGFIHSIVAGSGGCEGLAIAT